MLRELGHDRGCGWALYNLAWVEAEQAHADKAWELLLEALALFRATAYAAGTAACLIVAAFLVVGDDPRRAARWLGLADGLQYISSIDRGRVDQVAELGSDQVGRVQFEAARSGGREASAAEREHELERLLARGSQVGG